jgi:phage baseplate assembly protein W
MDKTFLGRGWAFPPEFGGRSKSASMVEAEKDIEESLRILMATRPKERLMQPAYGCGLRELVFETINESTLTIIRDTIRRAVLMFEPRITLESIEIGREQEYEGILSINLVYTIRATNSRSNLVYPFYFLEGTNVQA